MKNKMMTKSERRGCDDSSRGQIETWTLAKERRKLLEDGKGKEMDLPYSFWKECSTADLF